MTVSQKAIFLDRDGTLVHPRHYPRRPEDLVIYAGVPEALRRLQQRDWRLVVVTNQSGIARGILTEHQLARMHRDLRLRLGKAGVTVDRFYHCPHHPDGVLKNLAVHCRCRKPEALLLFKAAIDLSIDLSQSWLIGDILDDVEAGNRAGCRTILVDLGTQGLPKNPNRTPTFAAASTVEALQVVESFDCISRRVDLDYWPPTWGPRKLPVAIDAAATHQLELQR